MKGWFSKEIQEGDLLQAQQIFSFSNIDPNLDCVVVLRGDEFLILKKEDWSVEAFHLKTQSKITFTKRYLRWLIDHGHIKIVARIGKNPF